MNTIKGEALVHRQADEMSAESRKTISRDLGGGLECNGDAVSAMQN